VTGWGVGGIGGGGVFFLARLKRDVAVGDYYFFAGLVPAALVVDAGKGADGADDRVGGGDDPLSLFDEETEGVAGLLGSELGESEGPGVSPDDAAVAEAEFVGDGGWAVPVEDAFLDGVAVGVVADGAVGDVAVEGAVGVSVGTSSPRRENLPPINWHARSVPLIRREGWRTLFYWF
jgi:hypothetical protein